MSDRVMPVTTYVDTDGNPLPITRILFEFDPDDTLNTNLTAPRPWSDVEFVMRRGSNRAGRVISVRQGMWGPIVTAEVFE